MSGIADFFRGRQVPKASDGGLSTAVGQVLNKPKAEAPSVPDVEPVPDAHWMKIARAELGTKEASGSKDNARIVGYHSVTKGGASPDSVPWCASFANWVMKEAGIKGTGTKWARDWLNWGVKLKSPKYGCIAVYERNGPGGDSHVCFWTAEENGFDLCLGGNQSDAVNVKPQDKRRLLGYRWPKATDYVTTEGPKPITTGQDPDEGTVPWYRRMFAACEIDPGFEDAVKRDVATVLKGEARYREVEKKTGVPWWVIGALHFKEASCNFSGVLHNGEKIIGTGRKTTLVPAGRGPFATWEEAAIDALTLNGSRWEKLRTGSRDIGEILFACERFNGSGYIRGAGKAETSPYLWARSNINDDRGKYVRDGVFDGNATTQKTTGLAVLIKELAKLGKAEIAAA